MIDLDKEYGLVLSGGGAKGSFQIGAWKALRELDVKIKGIAGTSVGALNGAFIVQDDFDTALDVWQNISYKGVLDIEDDEIEKVLNLNYKEVSYDLVLERIKSVTKQKGLESTALKKLIDSNLNEEKIRQSNIELGLVTFCLSDFKPVEIFVEDIIEGELLGYLLASSYLPGFKREKINGKYYIDGGLHSTTPVELLINKGYKDIIVVKLGGPGVERKVDINGANVIIIESMESLGLLVEFSKEKANYNIELGYYNTLKVLKELKGDYYFIECHKSDNYFLKRLLKTNKTTIKKLIRGSLYAGYPVDRYFVEIGIPNLAKKMKLKSNWTYSEFVFTLLEAVGELLEIERFQIYTYEEFLGLIKSRLDDYKNKVEYDKKSNDIYHIFADIIKAL